MSNSSPRSHIEKHYMNPNLRADLTCARRGRPEENERGSFLSPGVNAGKPYDAIIDLSFQEHRYSLSTLSVDLPSSNQSDFSSPTVKVEQSHMEPFKQLTTENVILNAAIISQQNPTLFQGQDSLTPATSSLNISSSMLLSGSGSNSSTLSTGTFSRSQMASNDCSEAGGNHVRLTSKPSRDSLPHVHQNHQLILLPPSSGSVDIRRAVSPGSFTSFPALRSNSTVPVTNAQSRHDYRHFVGDLHENRPTSTSLQSMLSARPIRPLPSLSSSPAWSQESAARTHGSPDLSEITAHQASQSHPDSNTHSSSRLEPPVGPMHRSVSGSTLRGSLDGNSSNNDDEDLYDDNQTYPSPMTKSGKGRGKELDATELAAQKRQMDEYPKEEARKGVVGGPRIPSACDACKQSKVRCVFPNKATRSGESSDPIAVYLSSYSDSPSSQQLSRCERCILHKLDCRVSGRKKRDPPPSQNELERRNDYCSGRLLDCLLQLIPASGNAIVSANLRQSEAPLPSSVPISSLSQVPSAQSFMPQVSSSGPRYPGPSNPYPQLNQSLNLPSPSRTIPSLADLPPLPVLDKTTSRTKREAKIEKWIAEATERLIKFDYAQPLQAIQARRKGDESSPQWEKRSQVQYERENEEAWNDKTTKFDFGVNIEEMDEIEEDGDRVLDSDHILHATRAYLFGERDGGSFEDIPQSRLPPILSKNVITSGDATKLFDIFYDKMNMVFSACDPAVHTPVRVLQSSVFLFTTICAVASKHYTERPDLYPVLLKYAKDAAGQAIHGSKTVETTQAFLLLGVHMPPSQTFIADKAYLFLGLAIRIAIDIELYRPQYTYEPPPDMPEDQARRLLNRGRTWLNCFCNDRSISTQMGKATAILIRGPPIPFNIKTWWCCSKWNLPSDIHMCAYADLLSVMADFHDVVYLDAYSADGRKKPLNLDLVQQYADKISAVQQSWTDIIKSHFPNRADIKLTWRDNLWPFTSNYAKLVVLSIGLRNGMLQGLTDKNPFSEQSITAACALLTQVLDKLANLGHMRYCVEAYFVFMGFAAAFLLKILRRKFSFMRKPGQDEEIISLVERLIALLGSDEVAIDNRHTPKLYSRFLGDILAQYKRTHMKERSDVDPSDGRNHQSTPGSVGISVGSNIQSNPRNANVITQPMEDVQTSMYSYSPMQSMQYPDPRLDASPSYGGYGMGDISPAMDLDIPLPLSAESDQHTLLSMLPLEDPAFWDHLGMPLATNPETWPQVVDMTHGTGAGLYNPLQVHNPFQNNQANYRAYGSGMGTSFSEPYYRQYH